MPPATQALILSSVIVYFVQASSGIDVSAFALWPIRSGQFMPWQVVSYAFLHGSFSHLLFNMFGLWMFGAELERVWGSRRLLVFYFASVLGAALLQLTVASWSRSLLPTIGASGGLFGLLLGFAMLFPHRKIVPLIPPIPMPAWVFVLIYGLIELGLGVTGTLNGVAHFAHLGGIAGGWLTLRYWRGQAPFKPKRH
ncbi:MAG: rhomboid family intramembrane serine protease [Variovorax sp.]